MVLEHEIPQGSKLYFGESAKIKREIESLAAQTFMSEGFEEIATPTFSYIQHQDAKLNSRELLRLSNEHNLTIVLRNDSTLDVVRIITKRLGRSTDHKKWFYIQPVFSYPTSETNQIGAEFLDSTDLKSMCSLLIGFFDKLGLAPHLQLSNIEIPLRVSEECGIELEDIKLHKMDALLCKDIEWLTSLLYVKDQSDLERVIKKLPEFLQEPSGKLLELSSELGYKNTIISPLFYAPMKYYSDLFFRMFSDNTVLAQGGKYSSEDIISSGFAIYSDGLIEKLPKDFS
jgi:ATP phosphoribosyltransferase regulatory subunit HisZ